MSINNNKIQNLLF